MKIEVSDPTLVEDLIGHLNRFDLLVSRTGERTLDARFGWPLREDAAGLELDLYLRVWEVGHPSARAIRVGS